MVERSQLATAWAHQLHLRFTGSFSKYPWRCCLLMQLLNLNSSISRIVQVKAPLPNLTVEPVQEAYSNFSILIIQSIMIVSVVILIAKTRIVVITLVIITVKLFR